MLGMSMWVAAACVLVVYVGAAVQGALGIGLGMISSPILALADPDFIPTAIVLSVIPLSGAGTTEEEHPPRRSTLLSLVRFLRT